MPTFALKWTPQDPSDSLILTYHGKWYEQIVRNAFSVEVRLSGPRKMTPRIVYTYLTTPIRAIIARIPVLRAGYFDAEEVIGYWRRSLLTDKALREYAGKRETLYLYEFGPIEIAGHPIKYDHLAAEYGYFPSSNFFPLSGEGQDTFDRIGDFQSRTKEPEKHEAPKSPKHT